MATYLSIFNTISLIIWLGLAEFTTTWDQKAYAGYIESALQTWNDSDTKHYTVVPDIQGDSRNKRPSLQFGNFEKLKYVYPQPKFIRVKFLGKEVPVANEFRCDGIRPIVTMVHTERECYCDKECIIFHDCCVDAFKIVFETDNEEVTKANLMAAHQWYIQSKKFNMQTKFISLMAEYSTCININTQIGRQAYYMISRCPPGSSENLIRQCEHSTSIFEQIPASYKLVSPLQIVFRNPFCAICHGMEQKDIRLWDASAVCPADVDESVLHQKTLNRTLVNRCRTSVTEPGQHYGKLRKCTSMQVNDVCDADTHKSGVINDAFLCHLYIAPVIHQRITYRNIHCLFCKDRNVSVRHEHIQVVHHIYDRYPSTGGAFSQSSMHTLPGQAHGGAWPEFAPPSVFPTHTASVVLHIGFSAIIGFSLFSESGLVHQLEDSSCQEGFCFDFITLSCKQHICPLGEVLVGNECVHDASMYVVNSPEFLPVFNNELDELVTINILVNILDPAMNTSDIREIIAEFVEDIIKSGSGEITLPFNNVTENSTDSELELTYVFNKVHLADSVIVIEKLNTLLGTDYYQPLQILAMTISNIFPDIDLHCSDEHTTVAYHNMEVVVVNTTVYVMNETEYAFNLNNSRFILRTDANSSKFIASDIIICSYLKCDMVPLEANEYWIRNGSLVINTTGQVLPREEYEIRNNKIVVCLREIPLTGGPINVAFIYDRTSRILQYCATSLSIIALVLTIVIYVKSASVHTLHGRTLVSMSATLIVVQVTSLLQTQNNDLMCKIVGIVLHLAALSSFSWMSVIAFDMTRTFVSSNPVSSKIRACGNRYLVYAMIGWGVPVAIVAICIVLDNTDTVLATHYGEYGFCFMASSKAIMVFYSTPYIISLTFNIIAFVITVHSIASRRTNPNARRNDRLRFCVIYFKLAVAMGMTGTLAILASITNWVWLWNVSIIVGCLQGVFMFLIFALKARIWRAIKLRHSSRKSMEPSLTIDSEVIAISTLYKVG